MDGLDEISLHLHEDSVIRKILCREIFPECTIILTSRPSARVTLLSVCQPRIDKHVEIIGFTEQERVKFVTEVFSEEPELQEKFLKHVFLIPHIKSMMYIPLNCAIVAKVYHESQKSCHLSVPRTRTQLYEALTHCLLVRYMQMKNKEYNCTLPEGLDEEDKENFKQLAEFAFGCCYDKEFTYSTLVRNTKAKENEKEFYALSDVLEGEMHKQVDKYAFDELYSTERRVIFFKEDIPEGLVHFGFMTESTEMYASKGAEKTLSFLHLSLQEYLAGWHMAHNFDTGAQGGLCYASAMAKAMKPDEGDTEGSKAFALHLQKMLDSKVEPPIFMAGITGWKVSNSVWEEYLSNKSIEDFVQSITLIRIMYEAQNRTLPPKYFTNENRKVVIINQNLTPYECYALSHCVVHSLTTLNLVVYLENDDDNLLALIEIFVKGINEHSKIESKLIEPDFKQLVVKSPQCSSETSSKCLYWLTKLNSIRNIQLVHLTLGKVKPSSLSVFLKSMINLKALIVMMEPISLEWMAALASLKELESLYIQNACDTDPHPANINCWPDIRRLTNLVFVVNLQIGREYSIENPGVLQSPHLVHSLLNSLLRSNQITRLLLTYVSRETMAIMKDIILIVLVLFLWNLLKQD